MLNVVDDLYFQVKLGKSNHVVCGITELSLYKYILVDFRMCKTFGTEVYLSFLLFLVLINCYNYYCSSVGGMIKARETFPMFLYEQEAEYKKIEENNRRLT